jgi:glucose dehydrogenase
MKKRSGPEDVEPVIIGNNRYEALHWGKERGLGQNGGHVVAIDQSTGAELWVAQLYEIRYDPNMEADKQDTFLTRLEADAPNSRLVAEDERGRRFALDLFSRKATAL